MCKVSLQELQICGTDEGLFWRCSCNKLYLLHGWESEISLLYKYIPSAQTNKIKNLVDTRFKHGVNKIGWKRVKKREKIKMKSGD